LKNVACREATLGKGHSIKPPQTAERNRQIRFSTWELLAGLTVASVAFGVLKWLGFETTWELLMAAATVGAAVDPAWRIYRWWQEA
jgi:hypothetical protein